MNNHRRMPTYAASRDDVKKLEPRIGPRLRLGTSSLKSRQTVIELIKLMEGGVSHGDACARLGYRKDSLSRAMHKLIRKGDTYIEARFSAALQAQSEDRLRHKLDLSTIESEFFIKVATGDKLGKRTLAQNRARQNVRMLGLVEVVKEPRRWQLTDKGWEFYRKWMEGKGCQKPA